MPEIRPNCQENGSEAELQRRAPDTLRADQLRGRGLNRASQSLGKDTPWPVERCDLQAVQWSVLQVPQLLGVVTHAGVGVGDAAI